MVMPPEVMAVLTMPSLLVVATVVVQSEGEEEAATLPQQWVVGMPAATTTTGAMGAGRTSATEVPGQQSTTTVEVSRAASFFCSRERHGSIFLLFYRVWDGSIRATT